MFFNPERIQLIAGFILTILIVALLVVPICLLYVLVSRTDGIFDRKTTALCIVILLVSTWLAAASLAMFTKAKRHEILAASAGSVPFMAALKRM